MALFGLYINGLLVILALHTQLKALPPAVTASMLEALPPESQGMAAAALEMGAGMEEAESVPPAILESTVS